MKCLGMLCQFMGVAVVGKQWRETSILA